MSHLTLATYALRRQKLAVERVICASTVQESQLAARWAEAWHKVVQAQLDLAETMADAVTDANSHPHRRRYPRPANRVLH